ncbi:MAG: hypothetical protein Q8L37_02330 [Candidatus Gottesmanbacteria bacterium]|nr:hypothetical protein [Candidatus Gottesmanbacteria bacterium]
MAVFRVDYEQRNPKAHDKADVPEWLKFKDSAVLKKGKQDVGFDSVNVPVNVGAESITIFMRGVENDGSRDSVVVPLLNGRYDAEPKTLDCIMQAEAVFDFVDLFGEDEVLFIYSSSGSKRASVVYQEESGS